MFPKEKKEKKAGGAFQKKNKSVINKKINNEFDKIIYIYNSD